MDGHFEVTHFTNLPLTDQEKAWVTAEVTDRASLAWSPDREYPDTPETLRRTHRLALESVLLVALGVGAGQFFAGLLGEAGKDAWGAVKSVVERTFQKQHKRSWNTSVKAYLVLNWRGKRLRCVILRDYVRGNETPQQLGDKCDERLSVLSRRWREVEDRLSALVSESPSWWQTYEAEITESGRILVDNQGLNPPEDELEELVHPAPSPFRMVFLRAVRLTRLLAALDELENEPSPHADDLREEIHDIRDDMERLLPIARLECENDQNRLDQLDGYEKLL